LGKPVLQKEFNIIMADKKPISPARREQLRAAGRAYFEKYGSEHMRAIGKTGYFATGAKYGWDYINHKLFGVHLSTGKAQKVLLSNSDKTQLRMYLPDPDSTQLHQTLKARKQANKSKKKLGNNLLSCCKHISI
jgi:hypothetical protein